MKMFLLFVIFSCSMFAEATLLEFMPPTSHTPFYLKITAVAISEKGIEFATQYKGTVCIVDDVILDKANISGLELIAKVQSGAWEKVTMLCEKIKGQWIVTRISSSIDF